MIRRTKMHASILAPVISQLYAYVSTVDSCALCAQLPEAAHRQHWRTCVSKSALFFVLHSGQESVMSTVTLPPPALQTPAGLDALQLNLQQDLRRHA